MNITVTNGPEWPVDPKFNAMCGFDENGKPTSLSFSPEGMKVALPPDAATEATLKDQRDKLLGQKGWKRFNSGTSEQTDGPWIAIKALTDSMIASIDGPGISGDKTNIPLAAGDILPGPYTKITRTSGDFIAFYA